MRKRVRATIAGAPRDTCIQQSRRPVADQLLLAGLTLAMLLPFLRKAVHIDDPLFLWAAWQIQAHPADFYGFTVNWYVVEEPMHAVTKNPPLASYYLAAGAALFGRSEASLHAAMLLPAIGVVIGAYRLARRLCSQPLI